MFFEPESEEKSYIFMLSLAFSVWNTYIKVLILDPLCILSHKSTLLFNKAEVKRLVHPHDGVMSPACTSKSKFKVSVTRKRERETLADHWSGNPNVTRPRFFSPSPPQLRSITPAASGNRWSRRHAASPSQPRSSQTIKCAGSGPRSNQRRSPDETLAWLSLSPTIRPDDHTQELTGGFALKSFWAPVILDYN